MPPSALPSSAAVTERMRRQLRSDTVPELAIRRLLHHAGFRFRLQLKVPGYPRRTIDIAFTRPRVAVFVDGCFWHSCPQHATSPMANHEWWAAKLNRNKERDLETNLALETAGWTVVRIWEHEQPAAASARVAAILRHRQVELSSDVKNSLKRSTRTFDSKHVGGRARRSPAAR